MIGPNQDVANDSACKVLDILTTILPSLHRLVTFVSTCEDPGLASLTLPAQQLATAATQWMAVQEPTDRTSTCGVPNSLPADSPSADALARISHSPNRHAIPHSTASQGGLRFGLWAIGTIYTARMDREMVYP